jgi:hypothetical protein
MAVKDIVAGAEMFLRTAGVADENIRRQLLQRVQQQALEKSQMDLQREQAFQTAIPGIIQTSTTPAQEGAYGYGPYQPEQFDANKAIPQMVPYMTPEKGAEALMSMGKQPESFEQRMFRELAVAQARAGGKANEPSFYEKEDYKAKLRAREKTTEPEKDQNKSDYQLTRDSLRETLGREPTATEIQTAMDKRANDKASALTDAKNAGMDIPSLAKAVMDGQDAPIAIKGSMGNPVSTKVKSEVLKTYPKFSFQMADANYQWARSAANQRTIAMIQGALPRVQMLTDQINALGNTDFPSLNAIMKKVAQETGKPQYTSFDANRNAIVQEINTALSGSATSSDMRVRIELENIQSSRSPAQLVGAINNLNEALLSRWESTMDGPYPMEVVRGEVSMADYKKQFLSKYRGKFDSTNSTKGFDLDAINAELERRKGGGK